MFNARASGQCLFAERNVADPRRRLTIDSDPRIPTAAADRSSRCRLQIILRGRCPENQPITMRVAGAVVLAPQISPTITRAIFAPPTDDGSIGLA
jgi:hypothetical protein